ncbi:hypothetical protein [Clostridium sp. HBUAS56017]|uniref:hypothetical protein n=1 Tax=Clostridium sp. HBUAS56017 TaxID=2571128 RepID=UPI001177943C|nr:hypothetical protein [Clostridium sp. HBUAS56017]
MKEELKKMIDNYGIDVEDELDVSPFEFDYTFRTREYLAKEYELFDIDEKEKLKHYDKVLLSRAKEFYEYLKPLKIWGNNSSPIKYWWWHLDKVVSGQLKINIDKNEVDYCGEIIKLDIK